MVIASLLATIAPTPLCGPAKAQLMPTYSVAVVDFINESGVQGDVLARAATDAVVVEMSMTNRYDVGFKRSAIKQAMDDLDLRPPLDKVGLVRLGEKLQVDAMLQGSVKSVQLTGSGATKRAAVTLVIQLVDQASGEIINGAVQTGTSSARVGYAADDDSLILEAVNNAAFLAVKTMVDYIVPEATVQMNIKNDEVRLNKGARDGMKTGMRMIVLRLKEIIGYIEIRQVTATDSIAKVTKSMRGIQPEDKVRAIFEMPTTSTSLTSAPLPSGAPKGGGSTKDRGSKIGRFIVGLLLVGGLFALFKGGRGSEEGPNTGTAADSATVLTWNPANYNHGQQVLEYQILRDDYQALGGPVIAISDPSFIDMGRADVYGLYGGSTLPAVTYQRLDSNPTTTAPVATQVTVAAEPYGKEHQYMVRVLYEEPLGTLDPTSTSDSNTSSYRYRYTQLTNWVTATAIEPVRNADVLSPAYDPTQAPPEVLVSDLQQGNVNFTWNAKDGGDRYMMTVQPIIPGTGPTWTSGVIYGTSVTVSLPDSARITLATLLSNSAYSGSTMQWRVDTRHENDSNKTAWRIGDWSRFVIGGTPPVFP